MIIVDSNFKVKPEDELVLCCARTEMDIETEKKIEALVSLNLNWGHVFEMASRHNLKPLLYLQLNQICPDDVPTDLMLHLEEFVTNNARKNLFFLKEITEIIKSLNNHNIQAIPYKGPILAQQVYGNLTMRQFGDLDLFVSKNDVPKIKGILRALGYEPEFNLGSVQEQNYLKSQRELKFFNESNGVTLELHWKYSGVFLNLPHHAEKIFSADLKEINIGGVPIQDISSENLLLILSIHNASHKWSRLSWLVDIATLINNHKIDWPKVLKISKQLSIQRILLINIYLCQFLLNLRLDSATSEYLNDDYLKEIANSFDPKYFKIRSEDSLLENIQIGMKLRENKVDGIKDCFSGIFNPSFYELKHLELPPSFFFIYYIYRPFNLLKRYKLFK